MTVRLTAGGWRRRPITRFNQANLTTTRTSTTERDKPKPGKVCAAKTDAPTPKTDLQRRKEVPTAAVAAAAAAAREQPIAPSGNSSTDARLRPGRKVPMRCISQGRRHSRTNRNWRRHTDVTPPTSNTLATQHTTTVSFPCRSPLSPLFPTEPHRRTCIVSHARLRRSG
jgi:hypothetical protein